MASARGSLHGKPQKQKKLTDFEKKENARISYKRWKEKNPEKNAELCVIYYEKNKDRILAKQKEYRRKNEQAIKERLKVRRIQNFEEISAINRIKYWRNRQKELALERLKFEHIEFYKDEIEEPLPTLSLY